MDARSALFDLYGDHLRSRGGRAPVAALVRLLSPLGITAPAVRTVVSRMARQGWLERIRERARRERLRAGLEYLGYAPIGETTWVSPRPSVELETLLETERVRAERFVASYDGDPRGLAARAWDLDGLARAYQRWLAVAAELVAPVSPDTPDEVIFAARSALVHEWRKFLFRDPGLPAVLLPGGWPGRAAADLFDAESARLLPAAARFVDCCLRAGSPGPPALTT